MPKHRLIVPYFPACHKAKPVFFRKRRPAAGTRRAAKPNLFDYASTASRAAQPFFSLFLVTFRPFRARASATSWALGAIMPEHRNTPFWESTWGTQADRGMITSATMLASTRGYFSPPSSASSFRSVRISPARTVYRSFPMPLRAAFS